ncbi:MAG: hypothetical protein CFE26_15110 [Verrucomicrobiales bacterium VVV1]|nr:MAG: hypothetical protein CFE26_15110 [Verrucomicrobiales bacterium VVV1]
MRHDPQDPISRKPADLEILHRHLLGQLEPEEFQELENELLASKESRADYLRAVRLDAALHEESSRLREEEPAERVNVIKWSSIAIAAAAVVLAMLGIWKSLNREPSSPLAGSSATEEIATMADTRDCKWKQSASLKIENRLSAGMLELESGVALIEFDSGAKLALQGPARLELISTKLARLHFGNATVRCEQGLYSFSLQTPTSTVIDLGTEFGVAVEPSGLSEVHVLDGEVEVAESTNKEQQSTSFLSVGETMILASNGDSQMVGSSTRKWIRDYTTPADRDAKSAPPKIIARDSFPTDLNQEKKFSLGNGWSSTWWQASKDGRKGEFRFAPLEPLVKRNKQEGLGMLVGGWVEVRRSLAEPIDPEKSQTVYVGFSLHRMNPTQRDKTGKLSEAAFLLRSSKDPSTMLGVALSGLNHWVVLEPGGWERSELPALGKSPFYVVAKIEFDSRRGNRVSVTGFDVSAAIPSHEPEQWELVSQRQLAKIDVPLDVVALQVRQTAFKFGEITLGNSWQAVADPASVQR